MSSNQPVAPGPAVKMIYLIKRRPGTSREELIAYWFSHHMPYTIKAMGHTGSGYIGTIYDDNDYPWDGAAQMFMNKPLRTPEEGHGSIPSDSFHEHVQPYFGWATREHIALDGSEHLPVRPLTLGDPFPTSRSGFFKVTCLVKIKPGLDHEALNDHWLSVHVPNVAETLIGVGGFRYVVSLSLDPDKSNYAGMSELYFHDRLAWDQYRRTLQSDGMDEWVANEGCLMMHAQTEFVAIP